MATNRITSAVPRKGLDRLMRIALLAVLLISAAAPVWGQWEQQYKLIGDDPQNWDFFGSSVAINGDMAIVGAYGDGYGGAYLFDLTTGQKIRKFETDDPDHGSHHGLSVAIGGDLAVVGAPGDEYEPGAARLFEVHTGQQLYTFEHDASGAEFGWAVAISGDVVMVGAPWAWYPDESSGLVRVYDISDPANPVLVRELVAADSEAGDLFGRSIAIQGAIALIGAPHDDDHTISNTGSAYLFDMSDPANPVLLHKLMAGLPPEENRKFGHRVTLDGDLAMIGAPYSDDFGTNSGSAYLFNIGTGEQLCKITADDAAAGDKFGWAVAIDGDIAIVGSIHDDCAANDSGSAYVFDISDPHNPVQVCKMAGEDSETDDKVGTSVAVTGNTVVICAQLDDHSSVVDAGSAYVFEFIGDPCPADVNDDNVVDIDDLFGVLAAWGPCDDCPEDINGDGVVDIDDVFAVLADWGPCPR